ncbi:hypothetical protein FQN57_006891 [Myotisia sp. PD_48]|nr:hypothetical protein FQN57_006891 [Myotisia sp. PD_48]
MATNSAVPVPFSEPPWLSGLPSPYYTDAHRKFQKACRAFMYEHLHQYGLEYERNAEVPASVYQTFSKHNMLLPMLPEPFPAKLLKQLGINDILGVKVEDWDLSYTAIYMDEMARSGLSGPPSALTTGMAFGIPPLISFANKDVQDRFLPDLLTGKKRTCIAITEPDAGSDVANITTKAVKSADGKHYIVNGTKKWITNGIWADYSTMAVRTGGPGAAGLSLLVVPLKGYPGVTMRRIIVGGQKSAGTTFIELDDVKVPAENLIGVEGEGMKYIMKNFNHERLSIAISIARKSRVALSSAFEYCLKREAFGKPLMDQPVVRHRLAKAAAEVEMLSAWVEQFVYQVRNLPKEEGDLRLGGLTALAKAKAGMVINEVAQAAVLLFGGAGYTLSGQGELAQRILQDVSGFRIPGGSEDVMLDLAIRQQVKLYKTATKKLGQQAKF